MTGVLLLVAGAAMQHAVQHPRTTFTDTCDLGRVDYIIDLTREIYSRLQLRSENNNLAGVLEGSCSCGCQGGDSGKNELRYL